MSQPTLAIRAEYARLIAVRTQKSPLCFGEHDPVFGEARYEAGAVLAEAPSHSIANEAMAIVEMKEGKWEKALMRFELALKTCEKPSDRAESIGKFIALCREHAAAKEVEPNVQK